MLDKVAIESVDVKEAVEVGCWRRLVLYCLLLLHPQRSSVSCLY